MVDIQLTQCKNQHYIKTVSGKVVAQSIAFRVVSINWHGVAQFPSYLNAKGPTRIESTCIAHTSPHTAAAVTPLGLACVRLTGWPVSRNWRRAVLSADAGLLVLSLTVEALEGNMCQNLLPSGWGRSLGGKNFRGRFRPWGIFFGFYKTRHILLSDCANCTVLRAVVLTQYQRVTDRQTELL